mmetsp:Transcript_27635/g.73394  ORF Transcript_27635/g.73394 Transcript_27635/m.73394 type:complete len:269 (+) Transcript_27635:511-1317(+)
MLATLAMLVAAAGAVAVGTVAPPPRHGDGTGPALPTSPISMATRCLDVAQTDLFLQCCCQGLSSTAAASSTPDPAPGIEIATGLGEGCCCCCCCNEADGCCGGKAAPCDTEECWLTASPAARPMSDSQSLGALPGELRVVVAKTFRRCRISACIGIGRRTAPCSGASGPPLPQPGSAPKLLLVADIHVAIDSSTLSSNPKTNPFTFPDTACFVLADTAPCEPSPPAAAGSANRGTLAVGAAKTSSLPLALALLPPIDAGRPGLRGAGR